MLDNRNNTLSYFTGGSLELDLQGERNTSFAYAPELFLYKDGDNVHSFCSSIHVPFVYISGNGYDWGCTLTLR